MGQIQGQKQQIKRFNLKLISSKQNKQLSFINLFMSSSHTPPHYKKTYDDISFEKRRHLIYLINEEKWTIKAAAQQLGIKLCTAKYILYLYRKQGKIYKKKGEPVPSPTEDGGQNSLNNIVYVPMPVYIWCYYSPDQMTNNLVHLEGA